MKDKTYYIIYETTNLLNGKKYRGAHKTKNINDGYMGSGVIINQAILKYGKENFETIHLAYALSYDDLFWLEEYVFVTKEWVDLPHSYNLRVGGCGKYYEEQTKQTCLDKYGVEFYSQTEECKLKKINTCLEKYGVEFYVQTEDFKLIMKNKYSEDNPHPLTGRPVLPETKEKLRIANLGKVTSEETKAKISVKSSGKNNPNYGIKHTNETKEKCSKVNQKYEYKLISPNGEIFTTLSLFNFCAANELDRNAFRNILRVGRTTVECPKNVTQCSKLRFNTTGWSIEEMEIIPTSPKAKYPREKSSIPLRW